MRKCGSGWITISLIEYILDPLNINTSNNQPFGKCNVYLLYIHFTFIEKEKKKQLLGKWLFVSVYFYLRWLMYNLSVV